MTALSICIGSDDCRLWELVDTPAGALLGADLQQLYCKGSLPARFCTPEAVLQSPVAVMDFLYGLVSLADAMPSTIVSSAVLEPVASPLDSRLAMAAQLQDQKSGTTWVRGLALSDATWLPCQVWRRWLETELLVLSVRHAGEPLRCLALLSNP